MAVFTQAAQFRPFFHSLASVHWQLCSALGAGEAETLCAYGDGPALSAGVLWLAILPLFPPNITMAIMARQFYFCFIRPQYDLFPHVQLQTVVRLYCGFGAVASSLLSGLSGYIGLVLLWI